MSDDDDFKFEYRVGWSAFTNINFKGSTDWMQWDGYEETADEVEVALTHTNGMIPMALDIALESSGFDWWMEVREA